MSASKVEELN